MLPQVPQNLKFLLFELPHFEQAIVSPPAVGAGEAAGAGEPDRDGWREVDLDTESEEVAVSQLVALGAGVEVLEPAGLRRRLAALGAEIAVRNRPS